MKQIGVFSTAILLFAFLGATALAQTQQDQQGEKQGKQEEKDKAEQRQQDKDRRRDQQQQPAKQQQPQRDQQPPQQDQNKPAQQQEQPAKPQRPQHDQQPPQQDQTKPARQQQPDQQQQPQRDQQPPQQDNNRRRTQQQQQPGQQQQPQHDQQPPQQDNNRRRTQQQQQPDQQQQPQRDQQDRNSRRAEHPGQQPAPVQHQEERSTQLRSTPQQQRVWRQEQQRTWQQHRAHSFEAEHRSWAQRGGYNGYRIPDNDFHSHYGRDHSFRVFSLPFLVVGGSPRFQYEGYWFSPAEPYPEYWGTDWYQNDDVYVDYTDDGYYLYNRRFPRRPGIAISISSQQDQYPNQRYYRDQVPGGSYTQTCQNVQINRNTLYATCEMTNGGGRDTALRDFDQCSGEITNVDGDLECVSSQQNQYPKPRYYRDRVPGGSFTQTCQNVQVNGNTLYATCETVNGGGRDTALRNFDQCSGEITNVNGELQCR